MSTKSTSFPLGWEWLKKIKDLFHLANIVSILSLHDFATLEVVRLVLLSVRPKCHIWQSVCQKGPDGTRRTLPMIVLDRGPGSRRIQANTLWRAVPRPVVKCSSNNHELNLTSSISLSSLLFWKNLVPDRIFAKTYMQQVACSFPLARGKFFHNLISTLRAATFGR